MTDKVGTHWPPLLQLSSHPPAICSSHSDPINLFGFETFSRYQYSSYVRLTYI
uniref:Uncharacterized protein n=1 Tax=Oryza brachyantha TaxID=4533 RepID=J3MVF4_ORYBR